MSSLNCFVVLPNCGLNDPEQNISHREPPALRNQAQDALTAFKAARVKQFFQHNVKRGGPGVAPAAQIGVPAIMRDGKADILQMPGEWLTEKFRLIMRQKPVDILRC